VTKSRSLFHPHTGVVVALPVVVALGSNMGDSPALLREACERLKRRAASGFRVSSFWRSKPVDCPPGSPDFINAAACFQPQARETPESLLRVLQQWEREFGRQPNAVRHAPRPLDLDLIAFRDEVRNTREITLPHPRAHLRRFVLQPLVELDPDLRLPTWTMSAKQYLDGLNEDQGMVRIERNT
jgi:2-amino-4-hydroxy-6-hydroxymethyldihydropteridine diphosphokinase